MKRKPYLFYKSAGEKKCKLWKTSLTNLKNINCLINFITNKTWNSVSFYYNAGILHIIY